MVTLHVIGREGGRIDVEWDRAAFEYLVAVTWHRRGLLLAVQSRDQRRLQVLEADPDTGATWLRVENTDPYWTTIVEGVPDLSGSGDLVWSSDLDGARRLIVGGTPVTPPDWERTIHLAKSSPALEDQVEGLQRIAERHPDLDLGRVGIRGWSYGGYLAALAVLRRPDVFRAAVAGAPVTDQRLYDTHYQERYLRHPDQHPEVYDHDSLIADAPQPSRPLLLIHGLADDNVVVAHTLRLSAALLAAGRPHAVLPLPRVTHSVVDEDVAANLLRLEADFLLRSL